MRYLLALVTLVLLQFVVPAESCGILFSCKTGEVCIKYRCYKNNPTGATCGDRTCGSGRGCFLGSCYTSKGACKTSGSGCSTQTPCCDGDYVCSEDSSLQCLDADSPSDDECATTSDCGNEKVCYPTDGKCYPKEEPCEKDQSGSYHCLKSEQKCVSGNGGGSNFCITPKKDEEAETTIETTEMTTTTTKGGCTSNTDCEKDRLCYTVDGKCYKKGEECKKENSKEEVYHCPKEGRVCGVTDDKGKRHCITPDQDEEDETTIETTEITTNTAKAAPACEDVAGANCDKVAYLCENKAYAEVMKTRCPKTCNKCPSECATTSDCEGDKLCYTVDGKCYHKKEKCKQENSKEEVYHCTKDGQVCVSGKNENERFCIEPEKDEEDQTTTTTTATTTTEAGPACEDVASANCDKVAYLCENKAYVDVMTTRCPKTCNKCPTRCTSNSACAAGKLCYPTDGNCYEKGDACTRNGSGEHHCSNAEETCVNGDGEGQKFCIKPKKDGDEQTTTTTTPATTTTQAAIGGCEDVASANCEKIAYLCENKVYVDVMAKQCPKTCNLCPKVPDAPKCEDIADANCDKLTYLCNNSVYYDALTEKCPSTCKRC